VGKTLKYQSFVDRKIHKGPMGSLLVIVMVAGGEFFCTKSGIYGVRLILYVTYVKLWM